MESQFKKGEFIEYRLQFCSPWEVGTYERQYTKAATIRKRSVSVFLSLSFVCPNVAIGLERRACQGKSIVIYFIPDCLNFQVGEIYRKTGDRTPSSGA